jgi:hypothetical protein
MHGTVIDPADAIEVPFTEVNALALYVAPVLTLQEHAETINDLFAEVDSSKIKLDTGKKKLTEKLDKCRLEVGKALIAARIAVEVEHGPGHWEEWCRENFKRSQGDIRKLMKLAGAGDPDEALAEEREDAKLRMREKRANDAAVRAVDREFEALCAAWQAAAQVARDRFDAWRATDGASEEVSAEPVEKPESPPRETQQKMAYRWEQAVYADQFAEDSLSEERTGAYLASVAGDLGAAVPSLSFKGRTGRAFATADGRISFAKGGAPRVIALHEFAHVLTPWGEEGHGPKWISCYAALVEHYLAVPAQAALESQPQIPGETKRRHDKPSNATGWEEVTVSYDADDDATDEYDDDGCYEHADEYFGMTYWMKPERIKVKVKYDRETLIRWQERLASLTLALAA